MQILEACTLCAREIEGVSDLAQRAGSRWVGTCVVDFDHSLSWAVEFDCLLVVMMV